MSEIDKAAYRIDVAGGVATLSFIRPESGNAIPSTAIPALIQDFEQVRADRRVRALLIRGEGKHFSAGGDLAGFKRSLQGPLADMKADFDERLGRLAYLAELFLTLDLPVVAACRGGIAGAGMMYALGADVVVADHTARFVFAQQRIGLSPDGALSYLLPRLVGLRKASELILTGATVDALEAQRIGLISRIVAAEELETEAMAQAQRFATAARGALLTAKKLVAASLQNDLRSHLSAERAGIVACVGNPDFAEGVNALLDKRKPIFPSTLS